MPKTEGGQILPHPCDSHMISTKYDWHKKEALLEQKYFTGSMPMLTSNHGSKTCGRPEAFTSTTVC